MSCSRLVERGREDFFSFSACLDIFCRANNFPPLSRASGARADTRISPARFAQKKRGTCFERPPTPERYPRAIYYMMRVATMFLSFLALTVPSGAFQVASRPSLSIMRNVSPMMGPFDFLAFGQAAASHILLSDGGRANYIKQQIEDGKISFAAAAKEFSQCPSASKGGELGTFKPGDMVGPFNDYCFDPDTKVNELGIVRTSFGTHIIKLTKKP